ncbi:MAG TPA: response regulator, partial [Polyangiaceae bacterium]|nr:response regulator [Polyangiaceae bacterium]
MNLRDDNHWVLLGITDPDVARPYAQGLEAAGHHVRIVASAPDARKALNADHFDVVVLETDMGDRRAGLELGHEILREHARPEVIVMANFPSVANAVAVAKAGAFAVVLEGLPTALAGGRRPLAVLPYCVDVGLFDFETKSRRVTVVADWVAEEDLGRQIDLLFRTDVVEASRLVVLSAPPPAPAGLRQPPT